MKNIVACCLIVLMSALSMQTSAEDRYSKDCEKEAKEASKQMAKALEKEKWSSSGSLPLKMLLEKYNLQTGDCGEYRAYDEIVTASSIPIGRKDAHNHLVDNLARELYEVVKGTVEMEVTDDTQFSSNKMASLYKGEIAGCITQSFVLYKEFSESKFRVKVYFLVNKDRFEKIAKRAASDYKNRKQNSKDIRESVIEAHEAEAED